MIRYRKTVADLLNNRSKAQNVENGAGAEDAAELWLQQRGLSVVARNYRCKSGEIDRIMLEQKTLVFVEVRLRTRSDFGGAAASITPAKQQRLIKTAQLFLMQHPQFSRHACRFDVMLATDIENWQWLRDAFAGN